MASTPLEHTSKTGSDPEAYPIVKTKKSDN